MIRLYDTEFSAECYKARLLLALLGVEHELVPVDIHPGHDHEQEDFLALNPLGEVLRGSEISTTSPSPSVSAM